MVHPKWELIPGNKDPREAKQARVRVFLWSLLVSCIMWAALLRLAACGRL